MSAEEMAAASSAYAYPLLIKQLPHTPMALAADQEIVYRDQIRYRYRDFRGRLARVANVLASLGVKHGSTVAVMDWDSHRYLECYFRRADDGRDAGNRERAAQPATDRLLPQSREGRGAAGPSRLPASNRANCAGTSLGLDRFASHRRWRRSDAAPGSPASTKACWRQPTHRYEFAEFDENTRATSFYTTGTNGPTEGGRLQPSPDRVTYPGHRLELRHAAGRAALHWGDVYMPMTPMFHVHRLGLPVPRHAAGREAGSIRPLSAGLLAEPDRNRGVSFSHCVPSILQMVLDARIGSDGSQGLEARGWRLRPDDRTRRRAAERGIEVWCGYGMSETGPILTSAQVKPGLVLDAEHQLSLRCKTGKPLPLVDLRIVDPEMRDSPRRQVGGRGRGAGALADQAYGGDPAASGTALARGLPPHSGRGEHRSQRLRADNGPPEGRDQERRRMGLLARPGEPDLAPSGGGGGGGHRRPRRAMRRAAAGPGGGARRSEDGRAPDSIKSHLLAFVTAGTLSKTAIPERIVFVDAIDKTSVGKIDKKLLRQKYGTGTSASA